MTAYDWDFSSVLQYRDAFVAGGLWTLALSIVSIALGTLCGLSWGVLLAQTRSPWLEARTIASGVNSVIRAIPLLILILVVHYAAPAFLSVESTFATCVTALVMNLSAFVADVIRGALDGVPARLKDAGFAVGMTERQVLLRISIPEATRGIVPTLSLLYIDILKMSSLTSVVGLRELAHTGSLVSAKTYRPLEVFVTIAAIYAAIIIPLAYAQKLLEESTWLRRRG
jgi:polar amino acid transport system permease protein